MTPLAISLWSLVALLLTLGVALVAGSYRVHPVPPTTPSTPAPAPTPSTPPDAAPTATSPASQSFRVLAVEPVEYAYGKTRFRLSEFDPADASRVFMGSVAIEAAEVGVFAGLRAGDVITIGVRGRAEP